MNGLRAGLLLVCLVVALLPPAVLQAQEGVVIGEDAYWALLAQTDTLLARAIDEVGEKRAAVAGEIGALWAGVGGVRLADESVTPVDSGWLRFDAHPSTGQLQAASARVEALLAYRARRDGALDDPAMLAALERVLADERFRYGQDEGGPSPTLAAPSGSGSAARSSASGGLAATIGQVVLIAVAVLVVVGVLLSLARNLRVLPVELSPEDEAENIPPTAQAAADRAEQSTAIQDYRAAVRYLYLSSLLLLDERGAIHFSSALTNREHLAQVADRPRVRDLLHPIVETFDRVWYGLAPVDEAAYRQFRQRVDQLKQIA